MTGVLPRPTCTDFVELEGRVPCEQPAITASTTRCPHGHVSGGFLCADHASRIRGVITLRPEGIHCAACHQQPGHFAHCCVLEVTIEALEV